MAIYTQLSPTATPGRRYSFLAKTLVTGVHAGEFTELSVLGVPGARHNFLAKTPGTGIPHAGDFTALSVLGVPGSIHAFTAKTLAADEDRSPWWNWWRNHDGWYDTGAPSLAELVMSGQQTVIESPTGEDVPVFIPGVMESEEILLAAYGGDGIAEIAAGIGINEEEARSTVRWMARQERQSIIEWRDNLIDQNNLIMILAMITDD